MNWANVRLIFEREVRDQLRDRRTLFMIFVLPVLLYPLLGLSFFQIAQFVHQHPTKVLILGSSEVPKTPALIEGDRFAKELFADPKNSRLLELQLLSNGEVAALVSPSHEPATTIGSQPDQQRVAEFARQVIRDGKYPIVVWFPPGFAQDLAADNRKLIQGAVKPPGSAIQPLVFHNSAVEKSQLAYVRVTDLLERWQKSIAHENLAAAGIDPAIVRPFDLKAEDLAEHGRREAVVWSKIFPFLLLIWALTGAFYPAIDLCAGEKERGTLETLLSSPAGRGDIVWGKLLTVMVFSITTVVLNLLSMGISGVFILSKLPTFGPPPLLSIVWLLIAVIPVSAMFSALCLALAAFARSTKEGQYYLMPLVLVTMPLVVIPMAPGVELNLGNSLIPITGIVLLLRYMLEGNYVQALPYILPVVIVTSICCLLSIRWAIDQFNTENVLFRESERLDLGLWIAHLIRDREETPGVAQAILCGILILVVRFFMSFSLQSPEDFFGFARLAMVTQLVVIFTPAVLMTIMLTRSPRKTLLLYAPPSWGIPVAVLLALLMHPVNSALQALVLRLYPLQSDVAEELSRMLIDPRHTWLTLLVIAVVPAICEEIAFRGFILSGFRHLGHKWRAIVLASVFFGLSHAIFQQSLVASLLGIVIGYLAVQTGSILPAIIFHMLNNGLAVVMAGLTAETYDRYAFLQWLGEFHHAEQRLVFAWPTIVACVTLMVAVLYWMHRQPYKRTAEEALQEAIEHQAAQGLAG